MATVRKTIFYFISFYEFANRRKEKTEQKAIRDRQTDKWLEQTNREWEQIDKQKANRDR
jgi:hypothetical protein